MIIQKSKLEGSVKISGAKNSALKILVSTILTDEDVTINNFPSSLLDIKILIRMLEKLGKICHVTQNAIVVSSGSDLKEELIWDGPSIRNTLLVFGVLLARKEKARVPLPGGCKIGERKYDLHVMLLEKLGAKVWDDDCYLYGEAPKGLLGAEIKLPIRSTGATENAIITGSLAKGKTIIWNPHIRPEIIDLISFLRSMGAKIDVRGNESIRVEGINLLHGTKHRVIPDNMEAITYLIASVITNGDIEIEDFPFKHLEVPLIHLRESGAKFFRGDNSLIVRGGQCYPVEISTGPYPGINSDMQPLFAIFGLCAKGESKITDLRFPDRFDYANELVKLGGDLITKGNILTITGGKPLHGGEVNALDLRAGAALLLAGLVADGETIILNPEQIQRGYEHIDKKMQVLNGKVILT